MTKIVSHNLWVNITHRWIIWIVMRIRFWISIRNSDFYRKPRLWILNRKLSCRLMTHRWWVIHDQHKRNDSSTSLPIHTTLWCPVDMTTKRPHFCLDGETWTLLLMWDREKRIIAPPYDNFLHIPFEWYIWNIYTNDYFTDRVVSYMLGGNKEFSRLQSNKLESTKVTWYLPCDLDA